MDEHQMTAAGSTLGNIKTLKVDKNLVKIMERIEIKARAKIEKYMDLIEIFKDNKVFMKQVNDKLREIRSKKKDERNAAAKERELKMAQERNLRNIERM